MNDRNAMTQLDSITDDLRRDILSGRFPPGNRLIEIQLTEKYECSRAAVRSALVDLTAEALVECEANRCVTVRRISIEEAIQLTEARAALESLIASHAARNADDGERDELNQIIDDMRSAVDDDRHTDYSELNSNLHRRLREMSGHNIASHLVKNLRNRAAHHEYSLARRPGRPAESLIQHAAIVEAVVAGKEEEAAKAMNSHLRSVIDVLGRWGEPS